MLAYLQECVSLSTGQVLTLEESKREKEKRKKEGKEKKKEKGEDKKDIELNLETHVRREET